MIERAKDRQHNAHVLVDVGDAGEDVRHLVSGSRRGALRISHRSSIEGEAESGGWSGGYGGAREDGRHSVE